MVDYMGGDERIVQSARVSYGAGTKSFRQDRGLIHYLMRNEHTSPFEQVLFTFHCKMPIFVARQWVRHRTARLNEISGRYSIMRDEFYLPEAEHVRYQSERNKQGRSDETLPLNEALAVIQKLEAEQKQIYEHYEELLGKNVARELARINLPLSLYTEWYWNIDLHNLFHFLMVRLEPHAQYEIRVFGEALAQCVKAVAPIAYEAFEEHMLHRVSLSRSECYALMQMMEGKPVTLEGRALATFEDKLAKLKSAAPPPEPEEPKIPAPRD
jgi:thymidylate synthase (FAD)